MRGGKPVCVLIRRPEEAINALLRKVPHFVARDLLCAYRLYYDPVDDVRNLVERLRNQRGIAIGYELVDGADHFFQAKLPDLMTKIDAYLDAADVPARMT